MHFKPIRAIPALRAGKACTGASQYACQL